MAGLLDLELEWFIDHPVAGDGRLDHA